MRVAWIGGGKPIENPTVQFLKIWAQSWLSAMLLEIIPVQLDQKIIGWGVRKWSPIWLKISFLATVQKTVCCAHFDLQLEQVNLNDTELNLTRRKKGLYRLRTGSGGSKNGRGWRSKSQTKVGFPKFNFWKEIYQVMKPSLVRELTYQLYRQMDERGDNCRLVK